MSATANSSSQSTSKGKRAHVANNSKVYLEKRAHVATAKCRYSSKRKKNNKTLVTTLCDNKAGKRAGSAITLCDSPNITILIYASMFARNILYFANTDFSLCAGSWFVSYPMIIVSFIGILTAQGSFTFLQFIWMATLVATDT